MRDTVGDWHPFREPKMVRMGRNGDRERFVCLMEINRGEIVGATVTVPDRRLDDSVAWAEAMALAWANIHERAKAGRWNAEGSSFEEFDFRPEAK